MVTDTAGQIAVDTTSNQLRFKGTATTTLVGDRSIKVTIASSTCAALTSVTATSTIRIPVDARAFTISNIYCYTDTGTSSIRVGDGTNYTEQILCGSEALREDDGSIANGSFTAKELPRLEILNNQVGTPNQTAITIRYNYDAN